MSSPFFQAIHIAFLVIIFISIPSSHAAAKSKRHNSNSTEIDSPLLTEKIGSNYTIMVDINGNGEFTSIQAAIDSVPEGNGRWTIIHIRKGVYK